MVSFFRAKAWVKNCGNEDIARKPINSLHSHYFICSEHFVEKDFANHEQNRLNNTAIPTNFNHTAESNCQVPGIISKTCFPMKKDDDSMEEVVNTDTDMLVIGSLVRFHFISC